MAVSKNEQVFTVSVAAQLADMHAQTVRQYDRIGLVVAKRTRGGGRRYSLADVDALRRVQRLSQEEGINLAGIARIIELERAVEKAMAENERLRATATGLKNALDVVQADIEARAEQDTRVFAASSTGEITVAKNVALLRRQLWEAAKRRRTEHTRSSGRDIVVWEPRELLALLEDDE